MVKEDIIDYTVGIEILKNVSDYVNAGEVLAKVYIGKKEIDLNEVKEAFLIENRRTNKKPTIYGIIK